MALTFLLRKHVLYVTQAVSPVWVALLNALPVLVQNILQAPPVLLVTQRASRAMGQQKLIA
jgi:hypothetical protein